MSQKFFRPLFSMVFLGACSQSMPSLDSIDFGQAARIGQDVANASGIPGVATVPGSTANGVDIRNALKAGSNVADAATLTDTKVVALAAQASQEYDKQKKIAPSSSSYTKRLARLTAPHLREDGLKLNFKVVLEPEMNACSFADGSIRINSGMLEAISDSEVLAVIGHEIGHIKEGHRKEKLRVAYGASAVRYGAAAGLTGSVSGRVLESHVGDLAEAVVNAQFSQAEEKEADIYALGFLKKHHYDQQAEVTMLKKLAGLNRSSGGILSSHPDPELRAQLIAKQIEAPKTELAKQEAPRREIIIQHQSEPARMEVLSETASASPVAPASDHSERPHGWYVQIAAEESEADAQGKYLKLLTLKRKATTQNAVVNGVQYYRVLAGPYESLGVARRAIPELKRSGLNKGEPFVKQLL